MDLIKRKLLRFRQKQKEKNGNNQGGNGGEQQKGTGAAHPDLFLGKFYLDMQCLMYILISHCIIKYIE
jgi:hypothetical protein